MAKIALFIANADDVREVEITSTTDLIRFIELYRINPDASIIFPTLDDNVAEYPLTFMTRWAGTIMQCGWCLLTNFRTAAIDGST